MYSILIFSSLEFKVSTGTKCHGQRKFLNSWGRREKRRKKKKKAVETSLDSTEPQCKWKTLGVVVTHPRSDCPAKTFPRAQPHLTQEVSKDHIKTSKRTARLSSISKGLNSLLDHLSLSAICEKATWKFFWHNQDNSLSESGVKQQCLTAYLQWNMVVVVWWYGDFFFF